VTVDAIFPYLNIHEHICGCIGGIIPWILYAKDTLESRGFEERNRRIVEIVPLVVLKGLDV